MSVALVRRTRARSLAQRCALLLAPLAVALFAPVAARAEGGQSVGWGENFFLETGAGWKSHVEESPVPVAGLTGITQLASGDSFTLALLADGTVDSWGGNLYGELGDGSRSNVWAKHAAHTVVSGLTGVEQIAAGGAHAIALLRDGEVRVWGSNQFGQLGNGVLNPLNPAMGVHTMQGTEQATPVPVSWKDAAGVVHTLEHVSRVAAGTSSDYAILEGGREVLAWGRDISDELGLGESPAAERETCVTEIGDIHCSTKPRPLDLPGPVKAGEATVTEIAAGNGYAIIVLSDGSVWSVGSDGKGALGTTAVPNQGTVGERERNYPVRVEGLSHPLEVAAGAEHVLALEPGGEVVGWGTDGSGQLGRPSGEECQATKCVRTPRPVTWRDREGRMHSLTGISDISAGQSYSLALGAEGTVYSFGLNAFGTLGRATTCNVPRVESCDVPTPVPGIGRAVAVDAGMKHAQALLAPGVEPPAPPISVTPASEALTVQWSTMTAQSRSEYRVQLSAFTPTKPESYAWSPATRLTSESLTILSHVFTPLAPQRDVVAVRTCVPACEPATSVAYEKLRLAFGSPLP
jgi:alpha-tubulin suppressor-like RCC1 family protein